jgi:ferredoxin
VTSPEDTPRRVIRIIANRSACCGYGACAEICPEIFKVDDNGIVALTTDIVPPGLEERALEGVSACPQCALEAREE